MHWLTENHWWHLNQKLDKILENQEQERQMTTVLQDLTAEVAATVNSINAAIAVLGSTSDATQLEALRAELATAQTALDAAVAAKMSVTPAST